MEKLQKGRTMMETLAVLAIAAIISLFGLAAFMMAMNRHRADQILDYVNRCAVVAQSNGDGYEVGESRCGNLLADEPPYNLNGQDFIVSKATANEPTYTVTTPPIASDDIRTSLVDRSTTSLNGEIIVIWDFQGRVEFTFRK